MSKPDQKSEQSSAARSDHSELARGWRRVVRFLPIFEWLPRYGSADIAGDLMAGAVVAIMLVPQSMAYAMLAGLPLLVGLYASILPILLYAVRGRAGGQLVDWRMPMRPLRSNNDDAFALVVT